MQLKSIYELADTAGSGVEHLSRLREPGVYEINTPKLSFRQDSDDNYLPWYQNFVTACDGLSPALDLFKVSGCFVCPNGAVATKTALVKESLFPYIRPEDIQKSFQPYVEHIQRDGENFYSILFRNVTSSEEPLFFAREHGEAGYFHWIHSVLPRLYAYEQSGLDQYRNLLAISERFQVDSLETLRYQPNRILRADGNTYLCNEIIFCSPMVLPDITRSGGFFERALFVDEFCRSVSANVSSHRIQKRVYVTRSDAKIRRVLNEGDLMQSLEKAGFECVALVDMSFLKQVELFKSAEIVISVHGAGLSNVSFMQPGSSVIELLSPKRLWPTYRGVSARAGVNYFPYVGDAGGCILDNDSDIKINPTHFLSFLSKAQSLA